MSNRRSAGSHRSLWQQQKRRWRLSGLTLVILGVPVAMAALAGTVFAAGVFGRGGHHRPPGAMASASAPAQAAAAVNPNCTLVVPANPLTAQGLATPYQLTATNPAGGACHEANANQSAFVEAAILTSNGQLTLYDPLVVDQGTQPAAAPVPAQVPAGSTVGIWFGFNGTNLTLQSAGGTNSLTQGNCVNGQGASVFGQFAYCNAAAFFSTANTQIANNQLQVPPVGTAKDGMPCPTVRDFSVVDQDQSDNVVTHYLATAGGQTAQNNAANRAALAGTVQRGEEQVAGGRVVRRRDGDRRRLDRRVAHEGGETGARLLASQWARPAGLREDAGRHEGAAGPREERPPREHRRDPTGLTERRPRHLFRVR